MAVLYIYINISTNEYIVTLKLSFVSPFVLSLAALFLTLTRYRYTILKHFVDSIQKATA